MQSCCVPYESDSGDYTEGAKQFTNKLWLYKLRKVC